MFNRPIVSRAKMLFGEGKIDWVEICYYLGINICSETCFRTDCEEREGMKRKFCSAANGVISIQIILSAECYLHVHFESTKYSCI